MMRCKENMKENSNVKKSKDVERHKFLNPAENFDLGAIILII